MNHSVENSNLKIAFLLNFSFMLIEIAGGLWTNSIAILSDALHDLGDTIALGLSWYLEKISQKQRDDKFSYGYRRFSLLGAVISGFILLAGSSLILIEAIPRLLHPEPVYAPGMVVLAVLGVITNGIAVLKLHGAHTQNERVVALHLLEDVLGWIAVLVVSMIMLIIELPILDPLLSVAITVYILWQVLKNLRETLVIFLQAIPLDIDTARLKELLTTSFHIHSIHDLHIWTLDGAYNVLSLHVVVNADLSIAEIIQLKQQIRCILKKFNIQHVTIEIDYSHEICELTDC